MNMNAKLHCGSFFVHQGPFEGMKEVEISECDKCIVFEKCSRKFSPKNYEKSKHYISLQFPNFKYLGNFV